MADCVEAQTYCVLYTLVLLSGGECDSSLHVYTVHEEDAVVACSVIGPTRVWRGRG